MQVSPPPVSKPLNVNNKNRPVHRVRQRTHLTE